MTTLRADRPWLGLLAYASLTFGFSWIPAAFFYWVWDAAAAPPALRLLASSMLYALCMGWQPLLATWIVRRWVDRVNLGDTLQAAKPRFYGIATAAPLVLAGLAMAVALPFYHATTATDFPTPSSGWAAAITAVALAVSSFGGLVLIWVQALGEEVGWRGYFLARFMMQLGPRPGLALHGAIWGVWYAPILLMANGTSKSGVSGAGFILTCMLLGGLLGWLRLASKSVMPTTLANSVLTATAGLPLLLEGDDPGLRAAAYGPAGWLPLSIAFLLLFTTRLRHDVRKVPLERAQPQKTWLIISRTKQKNARDDRTLH